MSKFIQKVNEQTGAAFLQFNAKVISINDELRENSNGKKYVLATVTFDLPSGEKQVTTAMIYEKSLSHGINVGGSYVTTMEKADDGQVYIRTSHLQNAERIEASVFDALMEVSGVPAGAVATDESEIA